MVTNARTVFFEGIKAFNEKLLKELSGRLFTDSRVPKAVQDELLEHHTRVFVLDKLLFALGWKLEGGAGAASNMVTEAFLKSAQKKESILFLDYLGYEGNTDVPLLVFEAKRFAAIPPKQLLEIGRSNTQQGQFASTREALCAAFKDPSWLQGEWHEHVDQLTRYYKAVLKQYKRPPAVMAIGNGEWLVVLKEPEATFNGKGTAASFLVFESENRETSPAIGAVYQEYFKEIYEALAFINLCKTTTGMPPELIPNAVKTAKQVKIMRGVRLGYSGVPRLKSSIYPLIEVEPVAFVRGASGPWILIEITADGINMPHDLSGLKNHLAEVQNRSDQLLARLKQNLQFEPIEVSIVDHYADTDSFSSRCGVTSEGIWEPGMDSYLLVTGSFSHFILPEPQIPNCPKHFWKNCDPGIDGRHPQTGGLSNPSFVGTKAFFGEGTSHHCAAGSTHGNKLMPHDKLRTTDFGHRSSEDGEHFCEIFDFEQMLCCQTCVYVEVCSQSKLFKLPCIPR